jgi:Protein of unknown function (DUF3465)
MKKLLLLLAAVAAVLVYLNRGPAPPLPDAGLQAPPAGAEEFAPAGNDDPIAAAYAEQRSDVAVTGAGRVTRILGDDSLGDRHQRFILELPSGQTLLIAHNIDLAPRVEPLAIGDSVEFHGVYEWGDKGGIVHWTHHDPQGRHQPGWLKHRGRTYE